MSSDLRAKIRLDLQELAIIRTQFDCLISTPADASVGTMETAAACAMLHSFYTEIEKILKLIGREWDNELPSSDSWHKALLIQMATSNARRPAVLSAALVEVLGEFLAFRHLFRGASIALMRWEKLTPLISKVDPTYKQVEREVEEFLQFLDGAADHLDRS